MKKSILLPLCLLLSIMLSAQNAGDIDPAFPIGGAFQNSGEIGTLAVQTDGKTILTGNFFEYNGTAVSGNLLRLNSDGTKDSSFISGSGLNSWNNKTIIQPDGKIIFAGWFSSYNGSASNHIVRINADGTKDNTFTVGSGFDSGVNTLELQTDGKILCGGDFTTYNGVAANHIIRLNSNGTLDTTFNIGGAGFNGAVYAFAIQNDGKIVVGGDFSTYNGIIVNHALRLNANGSIDISGVGCNGIVTSIALQSDGKAVFVGLFTSFAGVAANRIIRTNSNGTVDTNFTIGTGLDDLPRTVTILPGDKIVVGGDFSTYNGNSANNIVCLNSNGTVNTTFNTGSGFNSIIEALAQSAGKIVVGGLFNFYNGGSTTNLVRLESTGIKDVSLNTGTGFVSGGLVNSIVLQPDGKSIIGGEFASYSNGSSNYLARLKTDGTIDPSFSVGTGFDYIVTDSAIQSDGKIIVGGGFTKYNGSIAKSLIRLNTDGTIDTSFNSGILFNKGRVTKLALQTDGKIIAGGYYTDTSDIFGYKTIRINTDGTLDPTFNTGTGFNDMTTAIHIQANGKIIIGGYFTSYNGNLTNRIIRLNIDGSIDTSFILGTGFNSSPNTIITQADGKILVGGGFTIYNGTPGNNIIRLNINGSIDTSFDTGIGFDNNVNAVALQLDGKIIAVGDFTNYNGVSANRIIRINSNGTKDTSLNTGTGANYRVNTVAVQADKKILIGGIFWLYNGEFANRIIRLKGDSSLAIENFNTTALAVYPNPAKSILNLQLPNQAKADKIVITDVTGKVILEQTSTSSVNTEDLVKGMYFIQVFLGNEKFTSKFIKE